MLKNIITAIRNLVGNSKPATIGIFLFVALLVVMLFRCSPAKGAEVDFRTGMSFGWGGDGAVAGLYLFEPLDKGLDWYAGTSLWGATYRAPNNWHWSTGVRGCRWNFCASLGAAYLQRADAINGSHTNFELTITYLLPWQRVHDIVAWHISNAGTIEPNYGRQAVGVDWCLRGCLP